MGRYLLIIVLFLFVGCSNPLDKVKENKNEIEKLKEKITKLEEKNYKINELESKIKMIKQNQMVIQKTINDNQVLKQIAELDKEIINLKNRDKNMSLNYFDYIVIHPMTLITIKKANIYNKPSTTAKIVNVYPEKTTFTTYKEKNGFVKITGYFVHRKWVENNKEWWIQKKDTTIKRLEK